MLNIWTSDEIKIYVTTLDRFVKKRNPKRLLQKLKVVIVLCIVQFQKLQTLASLAWRPIPLFPKLLQIKMILKPVCMKISLVIGRKKRGCRN